MQFLNSRTCVTGKVFYKTYQDEYEHSLKKKKTNTEIHLLIFWKSILRCMWVKIFQKMTRVLIFNFSLFLFSNTRLHSTNYLCVTLEYRREKYTQRSNLQLTKRLFNIELVVYIREMIMHTTIFSSTMHAINLLKVFFFNYVCM